MWDNLRLLSETAKYLWNWMSCPSTGLCEVFWSPRVRNGVTAEHSLRRLTRTWETANIFTYIVCMKMLPYILFASAIRVSPHAMLTYTCPEFTYHTPVEKRNHTHCWHLLLVFLLFTQTPDIHLAKELNRSQSTSPRTRRTARTLLPNCKTQWVNYLKCNKHFQNQVFFFSSVIQSCVFSVKWTTVEPMKEVIEVYKQKRKR